MSTACWQPFVISMSSLSSRYALLAGTRQAAMSVTGRILVENPVATVIEVSGSRALLRN